MTEIPTTTRQIVLASRPPGAPTSDNFRLETVDLPELDEGQVLVRNEVMSVDPYMRGRMNDVKSYVPPFQVDAPLDGGAVGEVIASRSDDVAVGQHVLHGAGWREHAVLPARSVRAIDTDDEEMDAFLFSLGCFSGEPITVVSRLKGGCVVAIKDGRYTIDDQLAGAICV